jgi:hypothetical protein
MPRVIREQTLSLFFLIIFVATLIAQSIAGNAEYNNEEKAHAELLHETPEFLSYGRYVTSSSFWRAVMENWQSEYLQFSLIIAATIWFVQRGSTESKTPGEEGPEGKKQQQIGPHAGPLAPRLAVFDDWRTRLYENSLLIVMTLAFFGSWFAHSVTGWSAYNATQIEHESATVSWTGYITSASFWEETLQNWQSEFLAVASMVALSIYLRQRGSPESKPTGAPHVETATEG